MIRATKVLGQHRWTQAAADTVVLDFDDRHRRRMAMTGTRGLEFLLDLENAVALRGGDALVLEDGRLIEVVAAAEPLIEIRGADPLHLVRVAWHLGNRHLPTQIMPKGLRIRRDHVIEAMVKGLGARIIEIEAPFDPEGGAYASSHAHAAEAHAHAHAIPRMPMPKPMPIPRMITIMVITTTTVITITTMATTITTTNIATTIITTTITPMLMTTSEPAPADAGSGMNADEAAALYRLMTWLSPSFPVGAFSYSSGIEWAVEAGDITDAASLRDWLAAMLSEGSGFCDAVFLAQAHRAASAQDEAGLREIAELAAAFVPSRERQLETSTQGRAFIEIARSAWACDGLDGMVAACGGAMVYPVAVGIVSAAHAVPLAPAMHAFLHAVVSNWISAGARLVPLGQTDSQRILASLEADVAATAKRALEASLDDLGSATFRADLASLRHETQYTRLFRS